MKARSIGLIIVIVLLLGGFFLVASRDSSNINEASQATDSSYVKTTSKELANITNNKRVLFFHAIWCSTCRALDKKITSSISDIPDEVTIVRVDYDKEKDFRKKYGVTMQHTLVQIDSNGNEITKWVGSRDLTDLLAKVQ